MVPRGAQQFLTNYWLCGRRSIWSFQSPRSQPAARLCIPWPLVLMSFSRVRQLTAFCGTSDVDFGKFRGNRCASSSSFVFPFFPGILGASTSPKKASLSGRRPRRPKCLLASPLSPTALRHRPFAQRPNFSRSIRQLALFSAVIRSLFSLRSHTPPFSPPGRAAGAPGACGSVVRNSLSCRLGDNLASPRKRTLRRRWGVPPQSQRSASRSVGAYPSTQPRGTWLCAPARKQPVYKKKEGRNFSSSTLTSVIRRGVSLTHSLRRR